MKDLIEVILENIQYVYPGYIVLSIFQFICGKETEDTERFFLKIVCISYVMVKIIDSMCNIIFSNFLNGKDIVVIASHIFLLVCSLLLPFGAYKILKSDKLKRFFKWNRIPIDTSNNIGELIERQCPSNHVVYIMIYLEDFVYEGVLANIEIGEAGFFGLKHWQRAALNSNIENGSLLSERDHISAAIIPQENVKHFNYEYIPNNSELPNKIH